MSNILEAKNLLKAGKTADSQLNLQPGRIPVLGQKYSSKAKASLVYSASSRLARALYYNETLSQKIKNWKEKIKNTELQKLLGQSILPKGTTFSISI